MGKFSVKMTPSGYSFNLVADNGLVVATSQVYTTKEACLKGIRSVQDNAPLAPVEDQTLKKVETRECPKFEVYKDKAGEFRFRLKAGNGEIIAASEGYKAKSSCRKGMDSVRANALTARTVEEKVTAEKVIYGNFITMDEKNPEARAVAVFGKNLIYVGDAEGVREFIGKRTKVEDYGGNYIYPGFLDSHCHGYLAGDRAVGQADLSGSMTPDYDKYREIIREYIRKNPQRSAYLAAGWIETMDVTKAYLDDICADKPLIMHSAGGHSMLLNTKALEWVGIDAEYAKNAGYKLVHVDEKGDPNGFICEMPVLAVMDKFRATLEGAKEYLLAWQEKALSNGFTGVTDAGVELFNPVATQAYHELEKEGRLKLRTYAYLLSPDNVEDPKAEVARVVEDRKKYSGDYFHVVGIKAFLDGITEAHTAWELQDYLDQPGNHGLERFNDHDRMVALIAAADAEGLSVHVHAMGSGATHFMLDCIEDAEKITGDLDQRNVLAHLQFVTEEDILRMAKTGSVPAVAPLWTDKDQEGYAKEVAAVGSEWAEKAFPIKSFFDAGACVVFHSDYPVSPSMGVPLSIYMAQARTSPKWMVEGTEPRANIGEAVTREQSLLAMTLNVARAWRQESRIGSLEVGKLANMAVFDSDFLHDDLEKVGKAKLVATLVDGNEVYRA